MNISNQNTNITFKSTPINYVNLKKLTNGAEVGQIKAVFSKLDPNCNEDIRALSIIKETWSDINIDPDNDIGWIAENINLRFKKYKNDPNYSFYAIELINNNPLSKKIVGLMELYEKKKRFKRELFLKHVGTNPDYIKQNDARKIKGIGEALLGEATLIAKQKRASKFSFTSTNNGFYLKVLKKAGIKIRRICPHEISNKPVNFDLTRPFFKKYLKYFLKNFEVENAK